MKQIKAKNEVKKAKTKGKQEGEEVMKKRNWVIMMSAAALAMASVTGCSSQNGGETTAKELMMLTHWMKCMKWQKKFPLLKW